MWQEAYGHSWQFCCCAVNLSTRSTCGIFLQYKIFLSLTMATEAGEGSSGITTAQLDNIMATIRQGLKEELSVMK